MENVALLIDGGHLRSVAQRAGLVYDVDLIEDFSRLCHDAADEVLRRVLYYDCPQYRGRQRLPVSGETKQFTGSDEWLTELAARELFAVRRGTLAFRGWVPRSIPIAGDELTDDHFRPNFEQKGVDMRIGLDIAMIAAERRIDRIILVTADTDLIPAMKHARKANLQVVGIQLPQPPAIALRPQFLSHTDYVRTVPWPATAQQVTYVQTDEDVAE
jgi:uncharacterized LabA/DUF88 family protein